MTAVPPDITLGEVYRAVCEIKVFLVEQVVSKEEHKSLKERVRFLERIVFGFCGLIVVAVVAALITGVVKV